VLELLQADPRSEDTTQHDPWAVQILTSQALVLDSLVTAISSTRDIEVVREVIAREGRRHGTTRPREAVLQACELKLAECLEARN
jgi:hypothetical protein